MPRPKKCLIERTWKNGTNRRFRLTRRKSLKYFGSELRFLGQLILYFNIIRPYTILKWTLERVREGDLPILQNFGRAITAYLRDQIKIESLIFLRLKCLQNVLNPRMRRNWFLKISISNSRDLISGFTVVKLPYVVRQDK